MISKTSDCRYRDTLLLVPLLLFCLSSPLLAQVDISAQLQGTVTDPSGAAVPGAQLVATNQETSVQYKTSSDDRGNYLFRSLPAGTYTISCEITGFKRYESTNNVILPQKAVTLLVTLQVGVLTQTVSVAAQAAMVDTVTSTVQTSFQERILDAVPVIGRDPRETMELLTPGAVSEGPGPSSNVPITSFNGIEAWTNMYRIDGTDDTDYMVGVSNPMPQIENLAEFSVTSSTPDASYGQAAGGQISAILKSGTNQIHGQGWGYFQNGAWNANSWSNNWLGILKPAYHQDWYGGNVGGPVYIPKLYNGKDKTFFFGSFERTSTSTVMTSTGQTITNAERQGDFTNSPDGIPVINGVPTPVISPTQFSTLGQTLMTDTDMMPAPTSGLDTFSWEPPETAVDKKTLIKIDQNISPKHRLFGSLWWSQDTEASPDMWFTFDYGSWATHYPNKNMNFSRAEKSQVWTINDTYSISPTLLNNFILGVMRYDFGFTNTAENNPLFGDAQVGINAIGDVNSPAIDQITTPRSMGMDMYQGYWNTINQPRVYFTENLTDTHGRHTLKMGFEFRQFRQVFLQGWDSGLGLSFNDGMQSFGGTGNGIADMMLGLAASGYQNSAENLNELYPSREAYFQDSMKLSRRLTLMLGVRWQPHFGCREADGYQMAWRPGQTSTVFPLAPTGVVAVGDTGISGQTYPDRWGNIGPRVSLAWDIFGNGKAAIRAGYALMSNYQIMLEFNEFGTSFPYGVSLSIPTNSLANLSNPYSLYEQSTGTVPFPYKEPNAKSPGNTSLVFPSPFDMLDTDKNYNSARVDQWNVTFDYQPTNTLLVSAGYVATRGTHLQERHDLNYPLFVPGQSEDTTANIDSRRPWFSDGGIEIIDNAAADFNSLYNSFQLSFRQRVSHGLTFLGNYTLSSEAQEEPPFSENANPEGSGDASGASGPVRNLADMALDYFSPGIVHSFALAFSYDVPIPTGRSRLLKSLVGGWTFGGSINASSGQYGSVGDVNCSEFNMGSAGCNATYVGGNPYATNKGQPMVVGGAQVGVSWLNPNEFLRADEFLVNNVPTVAPNVGQRLFLGNAVTGVFKGPAMFYPNASISKTFQITESLKLNWRVEATNVLNHTVLTSPGNTTVGPNMTQFGAISSAMNPRLVQMSAHFIF